MQQAAALKTSSPPSDASRITPRMVLFILVVLLLVGYPIYVFVEAAVTGGIRDRGDYKEVDLKAMSLFHFDQTSGTIDDVPQKWRSLDGQKVVVVGEMWAAVLGRQPRGRRSSWSTRSPSAASAARRRSSTSSSAASSPAKPPATTAAPSRRGTLRVKVSATSWGRSRACITWTWRTCGR